jgi:YggT family protein
MFANILHLIIFTFGSLLMLLVVLRFLLQLAKADFYNPISQGVVRVTKPLLMPLRRIIPGFWGIDLASVVLMLLIQLLVIFLMGLVIGQQVLFTYPFHALAWAVLGTLTLVSNIYFWAIIINIVVSWVAPHSHHPALLLISQLINPLMAPVRKLLPPLGGVIDISPILVLMGLKVVDIVIYRAAEAVYLAPKMVIGIW